jgi:hypothetical protein
MENSCQKIDFKSKGRKSDWNLYQSFELLNLDICYTNWLIHRFRILYPKDNHSNLIISSLTKYSQRLR